MRALAFTLALFAAPALAGGVRVNLQLGPSWVSYRAPAPRYVAPAYSPIYWYWFPIEPPPPASPPQVQTVFIERESEPAPPPQVIYVEQPAPLALSRPPPAAVPAPPPSPEPPKPPPPRVPGPDVFTWSDADGVIHYSTRVPADVKGKAKKLSTLAK